ncbi:MAG: tripartite tricarboxylate transporter substrate binding protein [Comamonas sp.]|jgi:tripartite-type tricarboxylate transporter receptor subunit TctC|uniref:Bug family tripartite tricarboxylate transporter substrate binding protein n=1 Tax=Comamonas sp. TaxID=34028 RepID=UPI00284A97C7|nr:tripartite tricarboxylate transporter substrate binding protein [Comamonas sp.]MDR3065295.1 tripartite tricarboxylate transporter substrate binding protein [Comamonas sp.]
MQKIQKNTRCSIAIRCVSLTAILAASGSGFAQASPYPVRPVRLVVGFAAGGPTDVVARALADYAGRTSGQPFVVENRPGANTILAAQAVAGSPADGYTLLFGATNLTMIPALYGARVKFDVVKSFQAICSVATSPTVLVTGPAVQTRTLKDFMAAVRAQPGKITAGSPGVGSSGHFATEMFARVNDLHFNHVHYKGAAPVVTDLMGGQLDSSFATLGSVLSQIKNGKLHALAVAASKRSTLLPQVPTFSQAGAGEFTADAWYGVLTPAGVPAQVVKVLEDVAQGFSKNEAAAERMRSLGMEPESQCGAPFAAQVLREVATYSRVAQALDITAE